jgi:hypothetical protein
LSSTPSCLLPVPSHDILTDSRRLFKDHINYIVAKSSQPSCAIFRGCVCRKSSLMRKAFVIYVQPILEYNSCIWNRSYPQLIDTIENVQRRYIKRIPNLPSLSYPERLAALNLDPLEIRCLKIDLIIYYRISNHSTLLTWDY